MGEWISMHRSVLETFSFWTIILGMCVVAGWLIVVGRDNSIMCQEKRLEWERRNREKLQGMGGWYGE